MVRPPWPPPRSPIPCRTASPATRGCGSWAPSTASRPAWPTCSRRFRRDRRWTRSRGSGVVAYTLKATGRQVLANDHLAFAAAFTQAMVANDDVRADAGRRRPAVLPNRDGRDFIQRTFDGLYFPAADHAFLDAAWSHLDDMDATRRALAISALCLAAARKQPRGVFTITTLRYDDGRRQLRMSLARPVPRGGGRRQRGGVRGCRRAERERVRRGVRPRSRRRGRRLPRSALRAAPRRHVLHQALPLPRGPRDVLARPGDHVGDAVAQARQAPHAVRLQEDGRARPSTARSSISATPPSSSPTGRTRRSASTSSSRSCAVTHAVAADRDPAHLRVRHARRARRRAATEYVLVGSGPKGGA